MPGEIQEAPQRLLREQAAEGLGEGVPLAIKINAVVHKIRRDCPK